MQVKQPLACAPIALFCYKRPDHLRQVVDSLLTNAECATSPLIVFCDGPRTAADEAGVQSVRALVRQIVGFASVRVVCREQNWGLADSIISGVTDVVNEYGRIIVLEDDTVVAPYFLKYMNDALTLYEQDERVVSVHGYLPPLAKKTERSFFLRGADCWGWATWARGWREFRGNGQSLLDELSTKGLVSEFDLDGAYPYTAMLEEWTQGKNDSWAIRWHASAFLRGLLTLYPARSLVVNVGNDGSGTHCADSSRYATVLEQSSVAVDGVAVQQDLVMREAFKAFYTGSKIRRTGLKSFLHKIKRKRQKKTKPWKERYGWFRTTLSWERATARCSGYDSNVILDKCRHAMLQVKEGKAVYERDSVLFDHVEYSWPLLAGLMTAAAQAGGRLHVLDVGGSLGSTYFQNRRFLECIPDVQWNVVEQPQFVECGRQFFQDKNLKFYDSIDQCVSDDRIDVVLIASTLQYVEHPYALLEAVCNIGAAFVLFDRTAFSDDGSDVLSIQKVDPAIYRASYPSWFLSKHLFLEVIEKNYHLVESFLSLNNPIRLQDGKKISECIEEGFVFAKKGVVSD